MKIAIVTNIITPYRKQFYEELNTQLVKQKGELRVFVMTDSLPLRPWTYNDLKADYTELLSGKKIITSSGNDWLFNFSVNKRLKSYQPDTVIVAGSWTYPTFFQMIFSRLSNGTKYYFWTESHTVRGVKVASKNNLLFRVKRYLYRKFDGYCVPGRYANDNLDNIVGKYGKRVKLPNLVDNSFYEKVNELRGNKASLRSKFNLEEDKIVFVTPARLISIKGIDLFLDGMGSSSLKNKATFVLAGEGPEEDRIKAIVAKHNLDVRFLGFCNQETVRELYACSDVFLLPSLSDANPLTVIEAAFAGLPLLVSKYCGNSPELCQEFKNSVLFNTLEQQSVMFAFEYIAKADKEWFVNAGKKSLQIAKDNFDCKTEVGKLIAQLQA